ncbi:MAG: sulfotransferase [Pseudomonadota bacterium]
MTQNAPTMADQLPNFIYGGPPKAGSSWIYDLLGVHPEVFVPDGKYIQFFTDFHQRGIDWYAGQFAGAGPQHKARCDLTTDYLFVPDAAERLAAAIPHAKVFFSLRNPVERDWSAYQHLLRVGMVSGALEHEIERAHRLLSTCSDYSAAIERSWRLFGRENTLILYFDEIKSAPQEAADRLHDFLGVARRDLPSSDSAAKNTARSARNPKLNGLLKQTAVAMRAVGLSKAIAAVKSNPVVDRMLFSKDAAPKLRDNVAARDFLQNRHAGEIARLEEMLQKDLSAWRPQD